MFNGRLEPAKWPKPFGDDEHCQKRYGDLLLPSPPLSERRRIVTLGATLSRGMCVRRISLGGEGNALYPVLSIVLHFSVCSASLSNYIVYMYYLTRSRYASARGSFIYSNRTSKPTEYWAVLHRHIWQILCIPALMTTLVAHVYTFVFTP